MLSTARPPSSTPSTQTHTYTTTPRHGIKRSHVDMAVSVRSSLSPLFEPPFSEQRMPSPPPERSHLALPPLHPSIRSAARMPPTEPRRGLDYRRPVPSAPAAGQDVVDLTVSDEEMERDEVEDAQSRSRATSFNALLNSDTRQPSIDPDMTEIWSNLEGQAPQRRTTHPHDRPPHTLLRESSSDLSWVNSTSGGQRRLRMYGPSRRGRQERNGQSPSTANPSAIQRRPHETPSNEPIDLTAEDDVIFVSERPSNPNRHTSAGSASDLDHRINDMFRTFLDPVEVGGQGRQRNRRPDHQDSSQNTTNFPNLTQLVSRRFGSTSGLDLIRRFRGVSGLSGVVEFLPPLDPSAPADRGTQRGFVPPGSMDYNMAGFDLGFIDEDLPRPNAQVYSAPDKPSAGFTRTPKDADAVVCPNCGSELCLGDDQLEKAVWVVKNCGHVYCGLCVANRSKKVGKGKQRDSDIPTTKPFSTCVVDGCHVKISTKTSMVQLFL